MERTRTSPATAYMVALPIEPPFGDPPDDDAFGSGDVAKRLAQVVLVKTKRCFSGARMRLLDGPDAERPAVVILPQMGGDDLRNRRIRS